MDTSPNTVAAILEEVRDDIHSSTSPLSNPTHPTSTNDANKIVIYVQDKNRFIRSEQHDLFNHLNNPPCSVNYSNLQPIAARAQRIFASLGTVSQGLLAGVALAQLFLGEASQRSPLILMSFFFLSTVCMCTVLDIFDLYKCESFKPKYILVLFLSVLTALAAFACTTYDTAIMSGSKVEAKVLETWRALNCCRCYGAVLGWIIIIIMKPKDQLAEFLNSN
ncbi:Transmembrane protein 237 [Cinara cedri]|uniref:Transmembrane protein 237 n=1 Tax=Cinara cedri TaxID=506608 RepID=A0A5E4N487_9HEMI|nr:Transmembrane protein 237 [Cinara cedri]